VSGLTPQIITETLFCLLKIKKISIDEIYVVTTSRGRDVIIGKDKTIEYPVLQSEIKRMCEKYKFKVPKFDNSDTHIITAKEESIELNDIRNDSDNILMPNKICEVIKQKSANREHILHCSISGGRKTMSTYMGFALSVFGRENDKLYHVLTSDKFEFKNFFPENKIEEKALEIAELPYIRLRDLIAKKTSNQSFSKLKYIDLVNITQKELSYSYGDVLTIDHKRSKFIYRDNSPVHIPPKLLKFYKFILDKKRDEMYAITLEELSKVFNIKIPQLRTMQSNVNKLVRTAINDIDMEGKFLVSNLEKIDFGEKRYSLYGIDAEYKKFKFIY